MYPLERNGQETAPPRQRQYPRSKRNQHPQRLPKTQNDTRQPKLENPHPTLRKRNVPAGNRQATRDARTKNLLSHKNTRQSRSHHDYTRREKEGRHSKILQNRLPSIRNRVPAWIQTNPERMHLRLR